MYIYIYRVSLNLFTQLSSPAETVRENCNDSAYIHVYRWMDRYFD